MPKPNTYSAVFLHLWRTYLCIALCSGIFGFLAMTTFQVLTGQKTVFQLIAQKLRQPASDQPTQHQSTPSQPSEISE